MKERAKWVIAIVVVFVVMGSLIVYLLLSKGNVPVNSYGCNEIMAQVDTCWQNRNTASQDFVECWEAPAGYTNTCEGLEYRSYLDTYDKCNSLKIYYYPPARIMGTETPEGLVSPSCPVM